jgi:2-polyprenyl-3-methyl-5-hydroxy-6-metoxy-1,4-benzoquinol methylase
VLRNRSHHSERLDNLDLKGESLTKTLDGLSVINSFFGNKSHTLKSIQELSNKNRIETIVDLGCGGGDNLRAIAKWFQLQKKEVKLIGIDGNKNSLEYSKEKAGFQIEYIQADILSSEFQIPTCDVLISSHFVYHFSDDELIAFLLKTKQNVNIAIVFSELQRSTIAYSLFKIFGFLMPFSNMVKQDGLLAIKRSFTRKELEEILKKAKIKDYSLQWKWWFRFILVIPISKE